MILNTTDKDSICSSSSSSSIIIHDNYKKNSSLLSCWGCSRTRNKELSRTVEDTKPDVQKGFFKRIQFFKTQKRQSSARKQRLASTVSNGHLTIETERLTNDNDEQHPTIPSPSHTESIVNYSDNPIHNSQSTPLLNRSHHIHNLNNDTDSYSFTDIEVASSINEEKRINQNATPKSIISHNISSGTTNLSTYSTQSLLRKLLDKAQVLDEYYNDISNKTAKQPPSSLSSSSHSLLGRSSGTSRPFHRNRSTDSIQKSQRRKYRNLYDNVSSDSSRFNLYDDEDNILRELIRFNNDIDLILSRLEMEGENLQQQQQQSNENLIQQPTTINPAHQSIPDICPQINDQ